MTLTEIANKYKTDKGTENSAWHGYTVGYEPFLDPLRDKPLRLLELGVLLYGPEADACSVLMWRDYFPNASIFTMDILDAKKIEVDRVKFFQGDVTKPNDLNAMLHAFGDGPFDVIVEDTNHEQAMQQIPFGHLFPLVSPGGLYIIEDILNPAYEGDTPWKWFNNQSTYRMLMEKPMKSEFLNTPTLAYLENNIEETKIIIDQNNVFVAAVVRKKL